VGKEGHENAGVFLFLMRQVRAGAVAEAADAVFFSTDGTKPGIMFSYQLE
jgi:hypothetical protein